MSNDNNLKIIPERVPLETDQGILESEEIKWGLPLKDVYKFGLTFYKGTLFVLIAHINSLIMNLFIVP